MKSFSELTALEKLIELLRWISVLPAAILCDFAGYAIDGTLVWLAATVGLVNPPSDDTGFNRSLRYVIWLFPVGVAVVIAGAKTAPRYRSATASVVAVLWIYWTDKIHGFEGPALVATSVAGVCGAAYIFNSERSKVRFE